MGSDINQHVLATDPADEDEWRRMAVNVAGGLAFHYPHELDDSDPKEAGRQLAKNPALADDLRELLDAIGYEPPRLLPLSNLFNRLVAWLNSQLTDRVLLLEAEVAVAIAENQQLKEGQ